MTIPQRFKFLHEFANTTKYIKKCYPNMLRKYFTYSSFSSCSLTTLHDFAVAKSRNVI